MDELLKTPFYDKHITAGARMCPFAGWSLPIQYTSVIEEHKHTRTKVSLFDISHMGEILVTGAKAFDFLQYIMTNDLEKLKPGCSFYSIMCNEQGGTIDDCFVYMFSREKFWLVVNASNITKDFNWLKGHSEKYDVIIEDLSSTIAKLDVQGPGASKTLKKALNITTDNLKRFEFSEESSILCSRTGYTGEDGFELYMDVKEAPAIWDQLLGADRELAPAGLGARDSLRIESCYSLYGHELNERISPVEGGIGWVVREYKDNFIGKEVLSRQKKEGVKNSLIAFEMIGRAIPRADYKIFLKEQEAGFVTSGTFSPTLEKSIGLGYIKKSQPHPGDRIGIEIRNKIYDAIIVKKPFYKYMGGSNG